MNIVIIICCIFAMSPYNDLHPSAVWPNKRLFIQYSRVEGKKMAVHWCLAITSSLCKDSQLCLCGAPWVAFCPLLGIWTADSSSRFEWDAGMPEGQMSMVNKEGNSGLALYSITSFTIQRKKTRRMPCQHYFLFFSEWQLWVNVPK